LINKNSEMIESLTLILETGKETARLYCNYNDHASDTVTIEFGKSFSLSHMPYHQLRALTQGLNKLQKIFEDELLFEEFTVHQMRWYVACCRLDIMSDHSVDFQITANGVVDYLMGEDMLKYIPGMSKKELIIEAISYNEDAFNTSRRIFASLDYGVDHWPEYREPHTCVPDQTRNQK
jgi:hypothetical protein